MERRRFLRGLLTLPLVPAALKGRWLERAEAEDWDDELPAQPDNRPPENLLAVAMGNPTVTVVVPPDQVIRVFGSALLTGVNGRAAELVIYEDSRAVAKTAKVGSDPGGADVEVVRRPEPGLHTYRLGWQGAAVMEKLHPPTIMVVKV